MMRVDLSQRRSVIGLLHKRHKTDAGFVPFEILEKSGLVNTNSRDRILVSVRDPDALPIKHDGFWLNAHRNCIEQRTIARQ
jgi:hypothetical protein